MNNEELLKKVKKPQQNNTNQLPQKNKNEKIYLRKAKLTWLNTGVLIDACYVQQAGFVFCARTGRPWLVSVGPELDTNQKPRCKVTGRGHGLRGNTGAVARVWMFQLEWDGHAEPSLQSER